ncbi:Glycine betaine/proline/choline transporter (plasmid) [Pseudoseohaeicola sp. NH-UV-7]|jgi:BCCT family betaine/carnitine transporter|uniref:BCCT family transporter n=1 Tax=unclassified Sulfitobacter TaxID=196795 RepID=UPI000E0A5C8B|nr:BCCT family transporter [Sulfitobacter sp. JL08]AXI56021.1 BCCT transporter [Sulfitobacter sp. JL08]
MADEMTNQGIPAPEGDAHIIETDYEIGQDNIETKIGPFGLDIHNPVFLISGLSIVVFVFFALALPAQAEAIFGALRPWLTSTFAWFFLGAGNIFVIFCLFLIVSPFGSVRLGGKDATPDYGYPGWFAMLFAAGMGIGLMFYGVSEPMSHFSTSLGGITEEGGVRTDWAPLGGAAGDAQAAISLGMAATIYHWGLHPWGMYAVVALALALFTYNKGLPLTIRSAFYPILGERVWGWWGHVIDILAVFATLFGLATSLGYGATQANAGLNLLFGIPVGVTTEVVLISAITAVALISVVRGLDGGVKVLSEINMGLAFILLLFVLLVGPTAAILAIFWDSIVSYTQNVLPLSQPFGREDANYSQGWTSFYWAWWISWSPFVGMFIARVSRGRTVREFIICVLLIPTFVCVLWMSVFGGTAITQFVNDGVTAVSEAPLELKLFEMLKELPLASITSFIGIILVVVFFVTSSDSGSLVIDTITAGGKIDAPVTQRVFWCCFEGAVAIALLIGGGLASLQAAVLSTGLPFTVVLLLMCWAVFKGLVEERRAM